MQKGFALLSYGLNAGLMLGITLLLGKKLSPFEYSRYSFAVASAQTLLVCAFEWLRLAAARNYPGPNPTEARDLREAFLGGQYTLGLCIVVLATTLAWLTSDYDLLLVALFAVSWAALDLHLTMLRFDSQLQLFSSLQTFRGVTMLLLVPSSAVLFERASASLGAGILANLLTISVLAYFRPGYIMVLPRRAHLRLLRNVAFYGISAAVASGLYQFGPFLLRCAAFRGTSSIVEYAAFSLVVDLVQRPFNVALTASNGVFFPDAVREHTLSSNHQYEAMRVLYAVHAWALLLILGCAMAVRNELLPLVVAPELLPGVLAVFPLLTLFFFFHVAIQDTSAVTLHLSRDGFRLVLRAAQELFAIVVMTALVTMAAGPGIVSLAFGGILGCLVGLLFTVADWRSVPCQLPWSSWTAALITCLLLIGVGEIRFMDEISLPQRLVNVGIKGLIMCFVIFVGGWSGFVQPFGLAKRLKP